MSWSSPWLAPHGTRSPPEGGRIAMMRPGFARQLIVGADEIFAGNTDGSAPLLARSEVIELAIVEPASG